MGIIHSLSINSISTTNPQVRDEIKYSNAEI